MTRSPRHANEFNKGKRPNQSASAHHQSSAQVPHFLPPPAALAPFPLLLAPPRAVLPLLPPAAVTPAWGKSVRGVRARTHAHPEKKLVVPA